MVVCVLLVLLTGAVTVSLVPALRDARLRSGTRIVLATLRAARDYAVAHATQARVRIGDDRRVVCIEVPDTSGTDASSTDAATWRTLGTAAGHPRTLPEGVSILDAVGADLVSGTGTAATESGAGELAVTFTVLGQGQDTRITLADAQDRRMMVVVEGITGACQVAEALP
jgi:hypothetical protein